MLVAVPLHLFLALSMKILQWSRSRGKDENQSRARPKTANLQEHGPLGLVEYVWRQSCQPIAHLLQVSPVSSSQLLQSHMCRKIQPPEDSFDPVSAKEVLDMSTKVACKLGVLLIQTMESGTTGNVRLVDFATGWRG